MRNFAIAIIALVIGCCVVSVANAKKVCEPNSVFRDSGDCNDCWCNADGTSFHCTKKGCEKIELRLKRDAEVKCQPGSRFKDADNCNWCTCNKEGTGAACTRRFCRPKRDVQTCTPNTQYMAEDGCNTCHCNADGTPGGCTEMACFVSLPEITRSVRQVSADNTCEPGSRFIAADGCNQCTCSQDGKRAACTRKFCIPKPKRVTREPRQYCAPKSSFKKDCNHCVCSPDGMHAACTLKLCIPKDLRVRRDAEVTPATKVCEPNSSFMDSENCNTCWCNEDGTSAACTLKLCSTSVGNENVHTLAKRSVKQICEPNSYYKEDCNTCHCSEDGTFAACTLMACLPKGFKLPEISHAVAKREAQVCEPNSTFMDAENCNRCWCNEEGTAAACTLKACFVVSNNEDLVPPEPQHPVAARSTTNTQETAPRICEPNKYTRAADGCNTCRCNAEGTAQDCTEVSCQALAGVEPMSCLPNSVFKQDCNTCKCNPQGDMAFCTRRLCRPKRENEGKEVAAQPTPCTPDDIKIEGCDRCKCAKNGIVWLCTPGSACPPNGGGNGNGNGNH